MKRLAVIIAGAPIILGLALVLGCAVASSPQQYGNAMLMVVLIGLYFLPTIAACLGKHHNAAAILVLNIFLGWTFVGWVAALVWAATRSKT